MSAYGEFAYFYDALMQNADYDKRCNYLLSLFEKYGKRPSLMLDLACGTGAFSVRFAKKGIEVIGVDMSEDMLSVARETAAENGADVLFLCQKAEELDLYGTVDGVVCCMDSINHITDVSALEKALSKVSLFLEPDLLFIFDINTPYKHREILGNNTFVLENEEVFCVWQNEFNDKKGETTVNLDFFVEKDGVYSRFSEEFKEKAYSLEQITALLEKCGFEILRIFDDLSEQPLNENSERAIIISKKLCV